MTGADGMGHRPAGVADRGEGVSGGGALEFSAPGLYANGATPLDDDDISLMPAPVAVKPSSWTQVRDLFR